MRRAVWALGVLLCAAGCGGQSSFGDGDGPGMTCDQFTPCGGNVVGTWDIAESCIDESGVAPIEDCADSTYQYSRYEVDGQYVFDANGQVTVSFDIQFAYDWNFPTSCFGGFTCADIEQSLDMLTSSTVMFDASCSEAPSECICDVSGFLSGTNSGTYTTSGNTMSLFSTGSESSVEYCVEGNNLAMHAEGGGYVLERD